MRHASLVSFLNGESSAQQLWQEIEPEVSDHLASPKGGVAPVTITGGPESLLTRHHADALLRALAENALPLVAASYIAGAVIMSDDFDFADDAVSEAVFYLSDESAPLSHDAVGKLRRYVSTAA